MDWKKISIVTDDVDTVTNRLYMLDIYEFEVVDSFEKVKADLDKRAKYWDFIDEENMRKLLGSQRVIVYVDEHDVDTANAIRSEFEGVEAVKAVFLDDIADEDWVNSWKKYFSPIEVGKNIVVVPCWQEELPQDRTVIRIDPGMIFGTGGHETTRLCLKEIEKYIKAGDDVLDLGCGSGILAIGARLMGANTAHCVDIEENAPRIVAENAGLNGISDIEVIVGDVLEDKNLISSLTSTKYDFIVANIVADVIIGILPLVKSCMREEAVFVCSGIIDDRRDDVYKALIGSGFIIKTEQSEDKWTAFTVTK